MSGVDAEGRHGLADVQPVWPAPSPPRPAMTVPSARVERDVNRAVTRMEHRLAQ